MASDKKKLNVPYFSQWSSSANASRDDCGPTCLAMVLAAYGIKKTVDEVFKATGVPPNSYINFDQLIFAAKKFGFVIQHRIISLDELKKKVEENFPAIALVNYRYFPNKQDKFNGPHFVTVFGKTGDSVFCHDPNRLRGNTYGDGVELPDEVFSKIWEQTNLEHGNKNNQVLIPGEPLEGGEDEVTRRDAITAVYKGIYGREPTKPELDRWDMSQKGIDECVHELLISLEFDKKLEEKEKEVSRLENLILDREVQTTRAISERDEARGERDEARKNLEKCKDETNRLSESLMEAQKKAVDVQAELEKRTKKEKDFGVQALEAEKELKDEKKRSKKLEKQLRDLQTKLLEVNSELDYLRQRGKEMKHNVSYKWRQSVLWRWIASVRGMLRKWEGG